MSARILIVDDEPHIRLLLVQTLEELEDEDVEILTASNGEEGLELIRTLEPELVFLDIMMPQINGFDVCRMVRHDFGLQHIAIVLLTAKGQEIDKLRGEEVGADLYITKPFDPDDILNRARSILHLDGA
jgi:two-component system, OmpR family, alkaline phosphatase synthesis response regulator PhoP